MYRQVDLSKCTVSNIFDKLIKVQTSWRELLVFSRILLNVFDDFLTIFIDGLVNLTPQVWIQMRLNLMD